MTDLVLHEGLSETALDLPENLSFEDWEQTGRVLGRMSRSCQWWIGDWVNFGERCYGEKYSEAIKVTGLDYSTVSEYAWIAKAIEPCARAQLSWSHHRVVASLDPLKRDGWLEEAVAEGWSVTELRKQVKDEPEEEPERCPTCGHRLPKGAQVRRPRKRGKP